MFVLGDADSPPTVHRHVPRLDHDPMGPVRGVLPCANRFDCFMPAVSLANAVRNKLAFLFTEHGFWILDEEAHCVRLGAVGLYVKGGVGPTG
jgi:hypothetical protein